MGQNISRRQLFSLGAVIALVPTLRLFPSQTALLAGRGAWLTPLLALPLLLLWAWGMSRLLDERLEGEQLPDLLLRLAGRGGKAALALLSLWTLLYAAFVLRSGADRLVGTVYPGASPAVFAQLMGLVAAWAAYSTPRALARMGRMLLPLLMGVLLLLLGFAAFSADVDNLLPLGPEHLLPTLQGAVVPLDVLTGAGTALCFLAGGLKKDGRPLFPALAIWVAALAALLTLLSAAVTGVFGAELAASLARPFFVLVRTLVFFRTVERVEALVVMLWVFPDFLMAALFLYTAQYSLRLLFGFRPDGGMHPRFDFTNGRWFVLLCGAAATVGGMLLAPTPAALERWSVVYVPALNLAFVFGLLPAVYFVSRRGRVDGAEPRIDPDGRPAAGR